MILGRSLARLPRAGTMHVVAAPPRGSWTALAIADETRQRDGRLREDGIILVGPAGAAEAARSMGIDVEAAVEPPLGMPGLLGRRLREVIARRGIAPLAAQAWGSALAGAVNAAAGTAERIVHAVPPADSDELCAGAAARFWRGQLESDRARVRKELGIPDSAFVVIAGGDCAEAIDVAECFAVAGRAAIAGAHIVLIAPALGRGAAQARRYAKASGLDRSLVTIDRAEMPSGLWLGADAMLLLRPVEATLAPWWGPCAWWALAAGLRVVAESCGPRVDGVTQFAPGAVATAALRLLELASLRPGCPGQPAPTHP